MIISLVGQLILFVITLGLGLLFTFVVRQPAASVLSILVRGMALLLTMLFIIHFFIALNTLAFLIVATIALMGWIFELKKHKYSFFQNHQFFLLLTLGVMLITSFFSNGAVVWYDTFLYHIQAVEWNDLYPAFRGLGTIHHRLAFNNSVFLLDAFIEVGFLQNAAFSIRNAFIFSIATGIFLYECVGGTQVNWKNQRLLLLAFGLLLISLMPIQIPYVNLLIHSYALYGSIVSLIAWILSIFSQKSISGKHIFSFASLVLIFPLIQPASELNSLSTDFGVFVMSFLVVLLLIKSDFFDALLLSVVLITIKISGWPLVVISFLYVLVIRKTSIVDLFKSPIIMLSGLLLILWQVSGVFLSGTFLFPALSYTLPVPWAMSTQHITDARESVIWWARYPGMSHSIAKTLGITQWLLRASMQAVSHSYFIISCLLITTIAITGWKTLRTKWKHIALLLIPALGFVSYIAQTPDMRLVGIWFSICLSISLYLLYVLVPSKKIIVWAVLILISINSINTYLALPIVNPNIHPTYPASGTVKTLKNTNIQSLPAVEIYTPVEGDDRCGFAPLPCVLNYDVEQYGAIRFDFLTNEIRTTPKL